MVSRSTATRKASKLINISRQGNGWIVSRWDNARQVWRVSGELSYVIARGAITEMIDKIQQGDL